MESIGLMKIKKRERRKEILSLSIIPLDPHESKTPWLGSEGTRKKGRVASGQVIRNNFFFLVL